MSTVTSCTLLTSGPAVRLANSSAGRIQSLGPATMAPMSSQQKRSRALSVCCATKTKGEHNPKTDLHPFNIPAYILVHPVPPQQEERWKLEDEGSKVNLWFEVPGHTKKDLAVEIDEDVLVIKKRANASTENKDQKTNGAGGATGDNQQGVPAAKGAATDGDVIYARLFVPAGYSKEGVGAVLKSGELEVSIARIKEQARRKISVNIDVK